MHKDKEKKKMRYVFEGEDTPSDVLELMKTRLKPPEQV